MRRLLLLVSSVVLVETAFYAVITPLLPELSATYHLTKGEAGVLAAAYPAGTLAGALPGGWLAARIGVRPTVLVGLGTMVVSSLVIAFAASEAVLDVARFVQGAAGAACWAGGFGWLIRMAPAERRGELIGAAMGAAIAGAFLGPVLGALADVVGARGVFCAVAGAGLALMAWSAVTAAPPAAGRPSYAALARAVRHDRWVDTGMWMMAMPGLLLGTISVLVPLRLGVLGAGAAAIAAVFLVAAGLEAIVAPVGGRLSDRHGRLAPCLAGLSGATVAMVLLPWPASPWVLAAVVVICTPVVGLLWAPANAMIADGAETQGMDQGFAFALSNLAWAGGQTIGAAGSARLAQSASDALPYLGLAAVCAVTVGVLWRSRDREPARVV
jgi:predicted MFS family arabinose efflux permease